MQVLNWWAGSKAGRYYGNNSAINTRLGKIAFLYQKILNEDTWITLAGCCGRARQAMPGC